LFSIDRAMLVIVDVQQKLTNVMHDRERLIHEFDKLIRGMITIEVPVIMTEQNPSGLGPTIAEIKALLPELKPISKMSFSCLGEEEFSRRLKVSGRSQVILTGIETHVCVYQTAMDLAGAGYDVQVVSDCVSSRTKANKELALQKMRAAGIGITGTEMILFELLKTADNPRFRDIAAIIK